MVSKSMKGFTMSKSEAHKRAQQKAAGKNGSTEKELKNGKKLDALSSNGKLPAIDGSNLTGMNTSSNVISLGTVSSGTITLTADRPHTVTFSGAATIALPTGLTSGVHYNCTLLVTMSSAVTITQPTVTWAYGSSPSLTSTSVKYRLTYETLNGGSTWYGYWTQLGA